MRGRKNQHYNNCNMHCNSNIRGNPSSLTFPQASHMMQPHNQHANSAINTEAQIRNDERFARSLQTILNSRESMAAYARPRVNRMDFIPDHNHIIVAPHNQVLPPPSNVRNGLGFMQQVDDDIMPSGNNCPSLNCINRAFACHHCHHCHHQRPHTSFRTRAEPEFVNHPSSMRNTQQMPEMHSFDRNPLSTSYAESLHSLSEISSSPVPETQSPERSQIENDDTRIRCTVCLNRKINTALGCGHTLCDRCAARLRNCHICRKNICRKYRIYL